LLSCLPKNQAKMLEYSYQKLSHIKKSNS
jgi:hypothetical protein